MNKTRESRKMTKELKKQQQLQQQTSTVVIEQTTTTITKTTSVEEVVPVKEESSNGELEIKCMKKEESFARSTFLKLYRFS